MKCSSATFWGKWLLVAIVLPFTATIFAAHHRTNNLEISPDMYRQLSATAAKSCSGSAYLKQVVDRGPVLNGDMTKLNDYLDEQATTQETAKVRAEIAHTRVICKQ